MDESTRTNLNNLRSMDRELQNQAFFSILETTDKPVNWAYEVWDELVAGLSHPDNHVRAISAQVLCNLAKSDPERRMLRDFATLLAVTRDQRFVTARHTLQAIWKVGAAGKAQQEMVINGLAGRFHECATEKNCTLIRYDITQSLHNLYAAVGDEIIREQSLALIETETDLKYRKKYAGVWRGRSQ